VFVLFCAAVAIQLIFFFVFIYGLTRKGETQEAFDLAPVSVIVCAHDEEQNLRDLIPLLVAQHYPDFEVIIVNDRSNDGTYDFLREASGLYPKLRVVQVDHLPPHANGKKYGLTLAIKAARNEVVLLTDADCRPQSALWIHNMMSAFTDKTELVLGYSPYRKQTGFLNQFVRFETVFTGMQYVTLANAGMPYMGVGRNLAYRKALFLENKGFNGYLHLTGGDDDLFVNRHATASNTRVCFDPDAVMVSEPKQTWSEFFRQKIRHLGVGKFYRGKHMVILGLFNSTHLLSWFLGISLLVFSPFFAWVGVALAVRFGALMFTLYLFSKRVGHKFEVWIVPLLDFLFAIYYLSTGTVALVSKKVQWKS
jgi:cellulose synthase/poly-beta-1,6-N-acetylglucosamine synthase-like glycosyltransferase